MLTIVTPSVRLINNGGAEGNRTPDLLNAIQALSQLSYGPLFLYRKFVVANDSICSEFTMLPASREPVWDWAVARLRREDTRRISMLASENASYNRYYLYCRRVRTQRSRLFPCARQFRTLLRFPPDQMYPQSGFHRHRCPRLHRRPRRRQQ